MAPIKEKFVISTKFEQLKILSLSPSSWSIEKASNFSEASISMVKRSSIKLKKKNKLKEY